MRQRNFLWLIGLAGLALVVGALSWGMHTAYGGLGGGYYAYSPILPKFVDGLPGVGPTHANNLGQYIPIATKKTDPTGHGDDYYELGITEYREQMNSGLPFPGTLLRGYVDLGTGLPAAPHYLGPLIIATKDKPVRIRLPISFPLRPMTNSSSRPTTR